MSKVKDRLYYLVVEKDERISREYNSYVEKNYEEHHTNRWKHWKMLMRLYWHYRVKKSTLPLIEKKEAVKTKNIPLKQKVSNSTVSGHTIQVGSAPYMNGLEAEKRNTGSAYNFARELMKYDVISFDIFDTLILRTVNEPTHLFMIVGEKLDVFNFQSIRIKAEREVRDRNALLYGYRECTLKEIYERVEYWTGIKCEEGAKVEFETELDFCRANPYMLQVYQILKEAGKKIYATSNMYLPQSLISKLLEKCGYTGFEEILVSCDYYCSKTNGALFEILKRKISGLSIIHIGDNLHADIEGAKKAQIPARFYESCNSLGMPHRSKGLSSLIGSTYYATVNNKLHNGVLVNNKHSMFWEYGYTYGGIIALGYVQWIHDCALREGKEKILFLSRDGNVLKRIYDMLYTDIPSEYFFWSRVSGIRATYEGVREQLLERVFTENANKGIEIRELLKLVNLQDMVELFQKNRINVELPLISENMTLVKNVIVDNWDIVKEVISKNNVYVKDYIKKCMGGAKSVCIVDIGWSGKNLKNLKHLFKECGIGKKELSIKLLGSICKTQNPAELLDEEIMCYMFSSNFNRDIHDRFCKESAKALEFLEKMFTAPHNSYLGFDQVGKMEFADAEIDNYVMYAEVAEGILDFCEDYYFSYKKYPYLLKISGYDAYIPYRIVLNNLKYAEKIFSNISFNQTIMPTNRKNMKEIMK